MRQSIQKEIKTINKQIKHIQLLATKRNASLNISHIEQAKKKKIKKIVSSVDEAVEISKTLKMY